MFFNKTRINIDEIEAYKNKGFLNEDEFLVDRIIYQIMLAISIVYIVISLIMFYKLRDSYIIRQRDFILTFTGGVFTGINIILSIIPQVMEFSCISNVISANILNTIINLIFLSRSLRVILFYHMNSFKVSTITESYLYSSRRHTIKSIEPNKYLLFLYRKINKIISSVIIFPTILIILNTVVIYLSSKDTRDECPMFKGEDTILILKQNKGMKLFIIMAVYGTIFMIMNLLFAILLIPIKDVDKYGLKFECFSVSILCVVFTVLNLVLTRATSIRPAMIKYETPRRGYLDIYERTKGGKMLFTFVEYYMFFVSITLPVIHYYQSYRIQNSQNPMTSLQHFRRVLKSPSVVNELRDIAIKEFSVENVLFWENYQILQRMVYQYQVEFLKSKESGNFNIINQFDFETYFRQQIQTYSETSMDEISYDPNMPVPKQILPYYKSFYKMFIDTKGPANVNISGKITKQIYKELKSYPTVGIYDYAKDEVVSMMYSSIYPILLKNNKKYRINSLC